MNDCEPYRRKEQIGDATLYLGDCLDILPTLEGVDAVVTDPPYAGLTGKFTHVIGGVAAHLSKGTSAAVGDEWGASDEWLNIAESVATKAVIAFAGHKDVFTLWERKTLPGWLITWYRRNSPSPRKGVVRFCAEYILALRAGGTCSWHLLDTVLDVPAANAGCAGGGERIVNMDGRSSHPTQKPIALMRRLILPEFKRVLDPFMGSGTTGVACAQMGRPFIGIEIEETYFNIACERIAAAERQPDMFVEKPEQVTLI